jgi:hypothetical protein
MARGQAGIAFPARRADIPGASEQDVSKLAGSSRAHGFMASQRLGAYETQASIPATKATDKIRVWPVQFVRRSSYISRLDPMRASVLVQD